MDIKTILLNALNDVYEDYSLLYNIDEAKTPKQKINALFKMLELEKTQLTDLVSYFPDAEYKKGVITLKVLYGLKASYSFAETSFLIMCERSLTNKGVKSMGGTQKSRGVEIQNKIIALAADLKAKGVEVMDKLMANKKGSGSWGDRSLSWGAIYFDFKPLIIKLSQK